MSSKILLENLGDFINPEVFVVSSKTEGQKISEDGRIILGARCAMSVCAANALHELAHFIEIPFDRVFQPSWGFIYLPFDWEPTTDQHIMRELRCFAIQSRLHEHLGLEFDPEYWIKLVLYMPHAQIFAAIREDSDRSFLGDKETVDVYRKEYRLLCEEWTMERVLNELETRVEKAKMTLAEGN